MRSSTQFEFLCLSYSELSDYLLICLIVTFLLRIVALYGVLKKGRDHCFASPWTKPTCVFHGVVISNYTSCWFWSTFAFPHLIPLLFEMLNAPLVDRNPLWFWLLSLSTVLCTVSHAVLHASESAVHQNRMLLILSCRGSQGLHFSS